MNTPNHAPSPFTAPKPLPKRDRTATPPEVLLPLFDLLDRYAGPIPVDALQRAVASVKVTPDQLGDAIAIDTGASVRTLDRETENDEDLVMARLLGQHSPIHDLGNAAACPASPRDILVTIHVDSPKLAPSRKDAAANDDAAVA